MRLEISVGQGCIFQRVHDVNTLTDLSKQVDKEVLREVLASRGARLKLGLQSSTL